MVSEVFNITVENKLEEISTGKKIALQAIPVHGMGQGSTVMPDTPPKSFKLTSSEGYIILKLKCLNHEIDNKDYITIDAKDKVQISVAPEGWILKISRTQSNNPDQESLINIEVGRGE